MHSKGNDNSCVYYLVVPMIVMAKTTTATAVVAPTTILRFNDIKESVSNDTIAMAKAMMIESVKRQMRSGVAHFIFKKKDGTLREAWGTTNKSLVEKHTNGNGVTREMFSTTAYFDIEKGAWRSFRWESIVKVF